MSDRLNIKTDISKARQSIINLFKNQCLNGEQSRKLKQFKALSCGQFLGALDKRQRGIHGTTAALKVLSDSEHCLEISRDITCYLTKRRDIERNIDAINNEKIDRDYKNIIKLSETLIALEKTDASIVENSLKEDLIQKITQGTAQGKTFWGYFANDESEELLPTAFAMIALSAAGHNEMASKAAEYIQKKLKEKYLIQKIDCPSNTDISIDVFCLFALTFRNIAGLPDKKSDLGKIYNILWEKLSRLICDEYEQNVEYYYKGERTCYIRVPWDLYLIALASHYSYERNFSAPVVQKRLNNLLSRVLNGGFIYPNSGKYISSRTNAILYDVLSIIEEKLKDKKIANCYILARSIWDSNFTRWAIRLILIAIGSGILLIWLIDKNSSISDLASEVFAIIATYIFTLTLRR